MAQLLLKFSLCATLNAAVDIMGFIVAAFLVDIPAIGQGSDCNRCWKPSSLLSNVHF